MTTGDAAARLRAVFLTELEDQLRVMNADLLALEKQPGDAGHIRSLFRVAHTLKGAARAAGVPVIERACHALEALLDRTRTGKVELSAPHFSLLFETADALAEVGARLRAGSDLAGAPLGRLVAALEAPGTPAWNGGARSPSPGSAGAPAPPAPPPSEPAGADGSQPTPADGELRIQTAKLDAMVASVEQLALAVRRGAERPSELQALHDFAIRWAAEWRPASEPALRAAREGGVPQAALRALERIEENVARLVRDSAQLAADASTDARALGSTTGDLADRVRRVRMRPFADACEALPRVVRDVAAAVGRDVRLVVKGGEVEADRGVLDRLREALLHLVRNAIDHGIEPPEERERSGKARTGTVSIAAALDGDRIVVTVADDGRGLDGPALRDRLSALGRAAPGDDRQLVAALFEGGVTTRAEATSISGRGVGLDLVRAAVENIGGRVGATWTRSAGTTVTLDCPLTLVSIRALLFVAGSQVFAFPTTRVDRLLRVRADDIRRADGRDVVVVQGRPVPVVSLARALGPPLPERPLERVLPVVILGAGGERVGLVVDELIDEQELVVRQVAHAAGALPHVSGAALLAAGGVAIVLDARTITEAGLAAASGAAIRGSAAAVQPLRRVLVVDDSITTRALEQSVLEAAGYEVITAVDGAEGWQLLAERGADLVVSDVEMPRMDGFALCEAIRASPRWASIPVILVTALESAEHRARGLELGADAYLGKSSFDQQGLLDTVARLLG